ncbi:MAG: ATP-binding protein [Spirosomataceae bacterium]
MSQRQINTILFSIETIEMVLENRLKNYLGEESTFFYDKASLEALKASPRISHIFKNQTPKDEELIIVLMALIPHVLPNFFNSIISKYFSDGGDFPEFGGVKGINHRGIIPTAETALFVLAGNDLEKRFSIQNLLTEDSFLVQNGILQVEPLKEGEPRMSGRLILDDEAVEYLILNKISKPRFSTDFGAEYITTEQEWDDLVLSQITKKQIQDIEIWLKHNHTLMNDWGMSKKIKPGYRALFHGPPGTGKTLTATLIGKYAYKDVFRIDLSKIISKYIGETEKNLSKIFDKAQNKNWILFFDEADAVFGKRTNVRDAHDKYANQEVSFLLQRIETYPGVVILASNLKSNMDEAFLRRFHSIIYFPKPNADERLILWQKAFPKQIKIEADLKTFAQKFELTGSGIINIVQRVCLDAIHQGRNSITDDMLIQSIRKEYEKEGVIIN